MSPSSTGAALQRDDDLKPQNWWFQASVTEKMWASHKLYWESVSFFPESGHVNVWKKTYDATVSASCRLDCPTGLAATDISMHGTDPVGQQCRTARKDCGVISIHKTELPSRPMDVFTTLLFKYRWVGFEIWSLSARDFTGFSFIHSMNGLFFNLLDLRYALNCNYKNTKYC